MARTAPAWVVPNITSFDIELREAFGSLEQYLASGKVGVGPQGPPGPPGEGSEEVAVQTTMPVDPNDLDLWFDTDAEADYATGPAGPAGPAGAPGAPGAPGPAGSVSSQFQGAWSPAATYQAGDLVTRDGSTWIANTTSTGVDPVGDATHTVIGSLTSPSGLALGSPQCVAQTFTVDREMTALAVNALAGFTGPPYDGLVGIASAINVPAVGIQWMGKADPDATGYALLDQPVPLSVGVEYWYVMQLSQANIYIDQGTDLVGSHIAWGNDFWYGATDPSNNFGGTYGIPFTLYGTTGDDAWQLFVAAGEDAHWDAMTQAEYDALPVKDPDTLYIVKG